MQYLILLQIYFCSKEKNFSSHSFDRSATLPEENANPAGLAVLPRPHSSKCSILVFSGCCHRGTADQLVWKQQKCISHSSGGRKSKTQDQRGPVLARACLPV